ncbi:MAG: SDR family oxidoreductase [Propionibacteriaceae bacterium]|nr:SDR family oxidoreductase [Propionibacteriaceae bacterium]
MVTTLVTGGGSGLGRRLCLQAAARGSRVVVWDLDEAAAAHTSELIAAAGGTASHQRVDVTDTAAVNLAAAEAGDVDVVINSAGVVTGRLLLEATDAQIRRTFEVNVLGLYWTTRAFLPGMLARDTGTIVTIASAAGLVGVARQTDYSASKWAAIGFTESLRAELRRTGVSTLVVAPYYIDTGMFAGVQTRFPRLLPILREADVATRILDAVQSGRQQLVLPPLARLVPALRVLPVRPFDALVDFFGINHTMDHFVGRGR